MINFNPIEIKYSLHLVTLKQENESKPSVLNRNWKSKNIKQSIEDQTEKINLASADQTEIEDSLGDEYNVNGNNVVNLNTYNYRK